MQEVAAKRCEEDGKRVGHFSHRFLRSVHVAISRSTLKTECVIMIGTDFGPILEISGRSPVLVWY
jgi:hypothetical protein